MAKVEQLARFAAAVHYDTLPAEVVAQVKLRILDALVVALGARPHAVPGAVHRFVAESAGLPAEQTDGLRRVGPNLASFYYSTLVRYLDFNDSYLAPGETFHPSDVIGGLLAAGDTAGADGRALIAATALSYQVQARLSEQASVRARGFDHTVQLSYAAAAALGRLLGLPPERIAQAVAISGTAHNALRVTRTGALSHWKGLAAPYAVLGAANAVLLARQGITGPAEVFEGNKGLEQAIAGPFAPDWGEPACPAVPLSILKRYNAEVHSQSALEGVLALRDAHAIDPAALEAVELEVFDVAHAIIGGGEEGDKADIRTKEEADHSLAYMVAVALLDGDVLPPQYGEARIARDDVQQLRRRVRIRPADDLSRRFPDEMPVRIRLLGPGGTVLAEREQADYAGFHTRPMTLEQVADKGRRLLSAQGQSIDLGPIVDTVAALERTDVRTLLSQLGW